MRTEASLALILALAPLALPLRASPLAPQGQGAWDEERFGPLPRWREGGTPAVDANQPLSPFEVRAWAGAPEMPPTSGLIASPPEYSPSRGVLFRYSSGSWPSVVTACVAALTGDPNHDEIAYVVVSGTSQQSSATSVFQAAGADLAKVAFITQPTDSIWLRDYGPHFVWQAGTQGIADSHYYPTRPQDNFIPTLVAGSSFVVPAYAMGLYYSGGNFQPGPNRSGFVTSLVLTDNPGMSTQDIADLYGAYQGIDTLHVLPRLPSYVDSTGHIDMWMYLVDDTHVVISQFKAGSDPTAISVTNNAVPYMESLGFTVLRTPAWNSGGVHYTYTNAFRVNDRIFVPVYGPGNAAYLADDQAALATWAAIAGPGVGIVPIDCYSIIPAAGAIHCIVMQVPRVTETVPAAHVCSPDGGECVGLLQSCDVRWSASDDVAVQGVDLWYSTDNGRTFPYLIAANEPDDGQFTWQVPLRPSANARLKVVAHDAAGNTTEAVSDGSFQIARARRKVYDFRTGAGVNKWGFGYQTSDWNAVNGVRTPVNSEVSVLSAGAYAKLAYSDASGGDSDANRYVAPIPGSSSESTHVFDFVLSEATTCIRDIELAWEGYGDDCHQVEMYVWDNVAGNWADAGGKWGFNAYLDNWAGNRDERLEAHLRGDFARYVDAGGRLSMLIYGERPGQETFHDYVSVAVIHVNCP